MIMLIRLTEFTGLADRDGLIVGVFEGLPVGVFEGLPVGVFDGLEVGCKLDGGALR